MGGKKRRVPGNFRIDPTEPVYTSGVVCRLLGIPVWVLKQLDRENVVKPPRGRRRSRLYSHQELCRLEYVWYYMKEHRVNVHGVKVILKMEQKGE